MLIVVFFKWSKSINYFNSMFLNPISIPRFKNKETLGKWVFLRIQYFAVN
jgi:hypothetical protein